MPAQPRSPTHPWWELFQDEQLQALIRTALERNYDLRIAAARILEAQAQLGITRADQFPTVAVGASVLGQKSPALSGSPSRSVGGVVVQGSAAWQLDFWGQYRRASEAARAQLLATEWGRRAIVTTLVSEVADAYFGLRALDLELDVARRTLGIAAGVAQARPVRERGGATSMLDVRQAEQLVYGASGQIANLERSIEQQENFISVLLGDLPAGVTRGLALTEQPRAADVPAGLAVGAARATAGHPARRAAARCRERRSRRGKGRVFSANQPHGLRRFRERRAVGALFRGQHDLDGVRSAPSNPCSPPAGCARRVELAEASRQEAELIYQQTVQRAFGEVSDALVGYRKLREFREQQRLLVDSAQDARRLADLRYQGGVTSYLEVLDADTRLFIAELGLAEAERSELTGLVEIYRALGGGWQQ